MLDIVRAYRQFPGPATGLDRAARCLTDRHCAGCWNESAGRLFACQGIIDMKKLIVPKFPTESAEWLARQMDREGMKYLRHANCFSWIDDFARAQSLMDQQLTTDWASALNGCVERMHPLFPELCEKYRSS